MADMHDFLIVSSELARVDGSPNDADRLQEVADLIALLPVTADGVRVAPVAGQVVWRHLRSSRFLQKSTGWTNGMPTFRCCDTGEPTHGNVGVNCALCYSTEEAAEAARDNQRKERTDA